MFVVSHLVVLYMQCGFFVLLSFRIRCDKMKVSCWPRGTCKNTYGKEHYKFIVTHIHGSRYITYRPPTFNPNLMVALLHPIPMHHRQAPLTSHCHLMLPRPNRWHLSNRR
jgi:hypothetical protein